MRTPKESFRLSGHAAAFKNIAGTEAFEVACDYALMELQQQMPPNCTPGLPTDPYIGIDANAQMWGAKRVIDLLKNLSEPTKEPDQPKRKTIYHE